MIEIRFHGRGGQGAVLASELLAQAAFLEGKYPQSFPFFGVERRGAPVTAFARIDDAVIRIRTGITNPDVVVVLDGGLLRATNVVAGLRRGGLLLINADRVPENLDPNFEGRLATVDATGIALSQGLGSRTTPIVNTALLGALARTSRVVSLDSILQAIDRFVPAKRDENRVVATLGHDRVRAQEVVIL